MSELYLPRNQDTSCVVIERRAAEAVDETLVKTLINTSNVEVGGQYLVGQERFYQDPISHRLTPWPGAQQFLLIDIAAGMRRDATSLRWREGLPTHPAVLQAGFSALTLYEHSLDRFIDVPVLPALGFYLTER